jgi:hypothetical protein
MVSRTFEGSMKTDLFALEDEIDYKQFAQRLWGNIYYNSENGSFHRKAQGINSKRTFVHFILEPLYKLYSQVKTTTKTMTCCFGILTLM